MKPSDQLTGHKLKRWSSGSSALSCVNMNTALCLLMVLSLATVVAQRSCKEKLQDCTKDYDGRTAKGRKTLCISLTIYLKCIRDTKESTKSCQSSLYYHGLAIGIPKLLESNSCGNVSIENISVPQPITRPVVRPECEISRRKSHSNQISTPHCGLFGDPHLRTFHNNKQTCVVEGAWPMVDNQYLAVQVTNVYLLPGLSDATATSKITIVIKSRKGCSRQRTYQALTHRLPAGFLDGSQETGPKSCPARLYEIIKGSLIHIDICYIKTKIIIRQVGHYLTFHIRMPQEVVGNSTKGLCVSGCPARERIDYRELLSFTEDELRGRTKLTRRDANKKCADANVSGFYLDSCLFDLLTTGDANFSAAAKSAMDDAVSLDPLGTLRDLQTYNITLPRNKTEGNEVIRSGENAAGSVHARTLFFLITTFNVVFTSYLK